MSGRGTAACCFLYCGVGFRLFYLFTLHFSLLLFFVGRGFPDAPHEKRPRPVFTGRGRLAYWIVYAAGVSLGAAVSVGAVVSAGAWLSAGVLSTGAVVSGAVVSAGALSAWLAAEMSLRRVVRPS